MTDRLTLAIIFEVCSAHFFFGFFSVDSVFSVDVSMCQRNGWLGALHSFTVSFELVIGAHGTEKFESV